MYVIKTLSMVNTITADRIYSFVTLYIFNRTEFYLVRNTMLIIF